MTFEVQQTRWDRLIRRVSGSIGPGSRVAETLGELFPVLDVERVPAELLVLGGIRMAMGRTSAGPVAANVPCAMLRNPGESGVLITVHQVRFSSTTAQVVTGGPTLNTLSTAGTRAFADTRLGLVARPTGQVLSEALLVGAPDFFRFSQRASIDTVWTVPKAIAVLAPGTALAICGSTVNTQFASSWSWQERSAEESELSL